MKFYSIYCIRNTINGKVYIGYTSNPEKRWEKHQYNASYVKSKFCELHPLYRSIRKNGIDKFTFEVIYQDPNEKRTKKVMEPFFIRKFNSRVGYNGYNRTKGGDCGPGVTSEQASVYNKRRVDDGTHYFFSEEAKKISSETVKKTNTRTLADGTHPFVNPEYKKKNSEIQQEKVRNGTHYLQSTERIEKMKALNEYKRNRQILKDIRFLYKKLGLNAKNLHTRNDEWILNRIDELNKEYRLV